MGSVLGFCLSSLSTDNWIDITALLINSILAGWVILVVQKNLANKRVLKDHFIGEIKDIQNEIKDFFKLVHSNKLPEATVLSWFKTLNIRIDDTMLEVNKKYKIDKTTLSPFQVELRNITTDSPEYISAFRSGNEITFSQATKNAFYKFQQDNMKLFNMLIISINNK
ncbi:hypothetical protein [Dyadobacter sp. CY343]|uniref:hypothetical protein n=1 Tax=Dyadobacter sp. CY343 TaxID=2907299 RepID=UPI001F46EF65|nr:hypothetical protein [Dyadobacter sp. CY343]MCE7061269.1 hypothetical protein [Dyadobacter sp. CY343]